jgi:hypothetical protein
MSVLTHLVFNPYRFSELTYSGACRIEACLRAFNGRALNNAEKRFKYDLNNNGKSIPFESLPSERKRARRTFRRVFRPGTKVTFPFG